MPCSRNYIILVFALAACAKLDAPLSPWGQVPAASNLTTAATQSRPWKSRCEGTAVFTDPTTLRITGICNLSGIGRVKLAATESVVQQPDGSMIVNAVSTYTAANGDALHTTSKGVALLKADFSGVTFTGIESAAGGTGGFSNATGRATRIGSTRFSDGSGSYANLGELTTDTRYCTCLPPQ